jgi:hypothetical protein
VFLARRDLAESTRRVYRMTLLRVAEHLPEQQLTTLLPEDLQAAPDAAYPTASPSGWNRDVATLGSFTAFCLRQGWLANDVSATLERRPVVENHDRALSHAELERPWGRRDVTVRDRCLWRMLYETAARAQEALNLDVTDLDVGNRRARVIRKGSVSTSCTGPPGPPGFCHTWSGSATPNRCSSRHVLCRGTRTSPQRSRPHERTRPAELSAGRPRLQAGDRGPNAAPAPSLGTCPPRRRQRVLTAADGQIPPLQPSFIAALCPSRSGCRRDPHRATRPRYAACVALPARATSPMAMSESDCGHSLCVHELHPTSRVAGADRAHGRAAHIRDLRDRHDHPAAQLTNCYVARSGTGTN